MRKLICILFAVFLIFSGCSEKENPPYPDNPNIVVLMYHRITDGEASNLYERSKSRFESDLKYLIKNNISVIGFDDLENISQSGKMPPQHSAIITFDDGDRSWYDIVIPILKRYGMKATFFLWVEKIGTNSFLNWQEVQYMSNITYQGGVKPFVFGSHSYSHPFLKSARSSFSTPEEYYAFLEWEFSKSKEFIEEYVPGNVTIFALPYGDGAGDPDIINAAQRNGYKFIRTSRNDAIGSLTGLSLFDIPSLPVLNNTEPEEIGYYLNN